MLVDHLSQQEEILLTQDRPRLADESAAAVLSASSELERKPDSRSDASPLVGVRKAGVLPNWVHTLIGLRTE
jgi:hypothetical protein